MNRFKEGKSHDMVPVGMSENKMIFKAIFLNHFVSQPANSCPGVNDNDFTALWANLNAGRIAPVLNVVLS
jgi:hypothetical protein